MRVSALCHCMLVVACTTAGCAAKLEAKGGRPKPPPTSGNFTNLEQGDGVNQTTVDATSDTDWQYFDFDRGVSVEKDAAWELAFCRYRVLINGGVSGEGGVEVASLEGEQFDDVSAAPSDGYTTDAEDTEADTNMDPDNVFNSAEQSWYDYNFTTHELTPHARTYVVHSTEDAYFKLTFEKYYDDAGTPAWLQLRWAALE